MKLVLLALLCTSAFAEDLKETLAGQERQLYEAWKAKSVEAFEKNLDEDCLAYTPYGTFDKKTQLEQQKQASSMCEVRSFSFEDMRLQQINKDTAILMYKVNQDALCGSEKVPSPLLNTAIYAKRGNAWKLVFRNSQPARK